jgi:hypothetical protein
MLKALGNASAEATTSPKRYLAAGIATKPMLLWPMRLFTVLFLIGTPGADRRCVALGIAGSIRGSIVVDGVIVAAFVVIHSDQASVGHELVHELVHELMYGLVVMGQ